MSPSAPKSSATPEELIRVTRQMTVATARAVSAGNANKQDQLTAAANLGRKTVVDLLVVCKVCVSWADAFIKAQKLGNLLVLVSEMFWGSPLALRVCCYFLQL